MEAKFLGEREKVIAVERLRANQMGIISREWRWDHVWETLLDVKTWIWFILIIAISYVHPQLPYPTPHRYANAGILAASLAAESAHSGA